MEDDEERLYLSSCSSTPRLWRGIYSSPERLFRAPAHKYELLEEEAAERSPFIRLFHDFPELLAGWPGLMLRYLPVRNIVRLSQSSTLFRHLGQDPNVFKLLCAIAWPGCRRLEVASFGGSWRAMYIRRPRPRTDGFYVVKWSTARFGTDEGRGMKEANKDFFKPVVITCMYRVLLFMPGGRVASLTTNRSACPTEGVTRLLRRALRSRTLLGNAAESAHGAADGRSITLPRHSFNGVSVGRYALDGANILAEWSTVPEEHPLMRTIAVSMQLSLSSSRPGANDVLEACRHVTGRPEEDNAHECALPPRPYAFIAFDKQTGKRLDSLDGWPDCYVGDVELGVACDGSEGAGPRVRSAA